MTDRDPELEKQLSAIDEDLNALKSDLRKRWLRAMTRWTITIMLYIYFWEYQWVRWSLWVVGPLIGLNILFMIFGPRLIEAKRDKLEKKLEKDL